MASLESFFFSGFEAAKWLVRRGHRHRDLGEDRGCAGGEADRGPPGATEMCLDRDESFRVSR